MRVPSHEDAVYLALLPYAELEVELELRKEKILFRVQHEGMVSLLEEALQSLIRAKSEVFERLNMDAEKRAQMEEVWAMMARQVSRERAVSLWLAAKCAELDYLSASREGMPSEYSAEEYMVQAQSAVVDVSEVTAFYAKYLTDSVAWWLPSDTGDSPPRDHVSPLLAFGGKPSEPLED